MAWRAPREHRPVLIQINRMLAWRETKRAPAPTLPARVVSRSATVRLPPHLWPRMQA
jgi:hypothetical protein